MKNSRYTKAADCCQISCNDTDKGQTQNISNVPSQKHDTRYYRKPETFFFKNFAFANKYHIHCTETKYDPYLNDHKEETVSIIFIRIRWFQIETKNQLMQIIGKYTYNQYCRKKQQQNMSFFYFSIFLFFQKQSCIQT